LLATAQKDFSQRLHFSLLTTSVLWLLIAVMKTTLSPDLLGLWLGEDRMHTGGPRFYTLLATLVSRLRIKWVRNLCQASRQLGGIGPCGGEGDNFRRSPWTQAGLGLRAAPGGLSLPASSSLVTTYRPNTSRFTWTVTAVATIVATFTTQPLLSAHHQFSRPSSTPSEPWVGWRRATTMTSANHNIRVNR
jgi:hypothetical protein